MRARANAAVAVIPLFVDDATDDPLTWMAAATRAPAERLTSGTVMPFEAPPVGTIRSRSKPMIEDASGPDRRTGPSCGVLPRAREQQSGFASLRKYPKLPARSAPRVWHEPATPLERGRIRSSA